MKNSLLLILLLPLLALRCNQDPEPTDPIDQLPEATQTGANTFGCLVDGEVYLPEGNFNKPSTSASHGNGTLFILTNNVKEDISMNFYIHDEVNKVELIELEKVEKPWKSISLIIGNQSYNVDDSLYVGEMNITRLDTVNGIFSGTFWFDAVNETDATDVVHITNGRFDLR